MHPYATDSDERKQVAFALAAVSIIFAWLLYAILQAVQFAAPWFLDVPSVAGFWGILWALFDRRIWRQKWLHRVGLVRVPDLNGMWKGHIQSTYAEGGEQITVDVTIKQTWTTIGIVLETASSKSRSLIGGVLIGGAGGIVISYEYLNEPKPNTPAMMQAHRGMATLACRQSGGKIVLEGDYYSGRGRTNQGVLYLERAE